MHRFKPFVSISHVKSKATAYYSPRALALALVAVLILSNPAAVAIDPLASAAPTVDVTDAVTQASEEFVALGGVPSSPAVEPPASGLLDPSVEPVEPNLEITKVAVLAPPWSETSPATVGTVVKSHTPGPYTVQVRVDLKKDGSTIQTALSQPTAVPRGQTLLLNTTLTAPHGIYTIESTLLTAEPTNAGEALDTHSLPVEVVQPLDLPPSAYIRVQDNDVDRPALPEEYEVTKTSVTITPQAAAATVVVYQPWLHHMLGSTTSDQAWTTVERDGTWVSMDLETTDHASFTTFEPSPKPLFTTGDASTVHMTERPMWVNTILVQPRSPDRPAPPDQANSSKPAPPARGADPKVIINFHDGNETGQPLEVSTTWLRELGFDYPRFRYDDGEIIPATFTGNAFIVDAPHFSIITIDDFECTGCAGSVPPDWNKEHLAPGGEFYVDTSQSYTGTQSLRSKGGESGNGEITMYYRNLAPGLTPPAIIAHARVDTPNNAPNWHRLRWTFGATDIIVFSVNTNDANTVQVASGGTLFPTTYSPNTWRTIAATDIDWTTCDYNLEVNGVQVTTTKLKFTNYQTTCDSTPISIDQLWIETKGWGAEGWWVDDIEYDDTPAPGTTVTIDDFNCSNCNGDPPDVDTWTITSSGFAYHTSNEHAAEGTHSLKTQGGFSSNHADGYATVSAVKPSDILFEAFVPAHAGSSASNWHKLHVKDGTTNLIEFTLLSKNTGSLEVHSTNGNNPITTASRNTWHSIELTNINWATCQYNLRIDAGPTLGPYGFAPSTCPATTEMTRIQVRSRGYSAEPWWVDNIRYVTPDGGGGATGTEDFEGGIPSDWTVVDNGEGASWDVSTCQAHESTKAARFWDQDLTCPGDFDTGQRVIGSLTSPAFDVPSSTPTVAFWTFWETENSGTYDQKEVYKLVNGGGPEFVMRVDSTNTDEQVWRQHILDLSANAGDSVQIRFSFDSVDHQLNGEQGWYIDDFAFPGSAPPPNEAPVACFDVSPTEGTTSTTFSFDASCTTDADDALSTIEVRWDFDSDGTWEEQFSTIKTASYEYSNAGTMTVTLEVRDPNGATDQAQDTVSVNTEPDACFTTSTTQRTVSVDASCSTDPDGDPLSYSWIWDDGTTDTGGPANSHTYNACPSGSFTITLVVNDNHGATDSTGRGVTPTDTNDDDNDALVQCEEDEYGTLDTDPDTDDDGLQDGAEAHIYGTDPADADTDDDGFNDKDEIENFASKVADPEAVFCGPGGSPCAYPDVFIPDTYLEVDGWQNCGFFTCDTHLMSNTVRDALIDIYAAEGIRLHIDNGQLDATGVGGGQVIPGDDEVEWALLVIRYGDDPDYIHPDRLGIFHQMIYVHHLTDGGDRKCGTAAASSTLSAVAHGDVLDDTLIRNCSNFNQETEAIQRITLQEFGHNHMNVIEPGTDQCAGDGGHDKWSDHAMAGADCNPTRAIIDYHDNRWTELMVHVDDGECFENKFPHRDNSLECPSPGDLNNNL